jgi:hypothetical protein
VREFCRRGFSLSYSTVFISDVDALTGPARLAVVYLRGCRAVLCRLKVKSSWLFLRSDRLPSGCVDASSYVVDSAWRFWAVEQPPSYVSGHGAYFNAYLSWSLVVNA